MCEDVRVGGIFDLEWINGELRGEDECWPEQGEDIGLSSISKSC